MPRPQLCSQSFSIKVSLEPCGVSWSVGGEWKRGGRARELPQFGAFASSAPLAFRGPPPCGHLGQPVAEALGQATRSPRAWVPRASAWRLGISLSPAGPLAVLSQFPPLWCVPQLPPWPPFPSPPAGARDPLPELRLASLPAQGSRPGCPASPSEHPRCLPGLSSGGLPHTCAWAALSAVELLFPLPLSVRGAAGDSGPYSAVLPCLSIPCVPLAWEWGGWPPQSGQDMRHPEAGRSQRRLPSPPGPHQDTGQVGAVKKGWKL